MDADAAPGDPVTPVRVQLLHESDRTRVTRLYLPGGTVVRKEPLGPDAQERLRRELTMLERLRGVEGTPQLSDGPRDAGSIVVDDVGGASVAEMAKPLAVEDLIALALQLAGAMAGMHRRGVMHRDINPANIVVSRDGSPCLVDFALATSFAEIRPEFTHHSEIVGTLAYLAPEQTGRTGRSVDQRADLYALGATLYELATGSPPFGSGDPLRLTHDHLARVPVSPEQVNPAIPTTLSAIIMHLLEKEPDNRYQTAEGVIYDLELLRDAKGPAFAAALRVGQHDVPLRLLPPSRLVGRDDEVAALHAAFREALAGRCRGVLVSGAPGVGKTALADELRSLVTTSDGWFVSGKFDQYRRDLDFDAIYQASRAVGRLLLAEPEDELAEVRERMLDAAGPNAGLLTALQPEFEALLRVPPDAGDPLTAQARSQRVGVDVMRAIATGKRPLVMFLDDLQWAGHASLDFIDLLLSEEPVDDLLVVAAFREDEVHVAHPLAAPLSRWRDHAEVRHLRLDNLPFAGSVNLVAEMLHVESAPAAGLVEVIEPHTSGNPYETVELLNALRRQNLLTVTPSGWRWDAGLVRTYLGESDLAGMVAARIDAMPAQTRQLLQEMACLGGRLDLSLVQTAAGATADVVQQLLAAAFDEGILVVEPGVHPAVRFRHDRIREVIVGGLDSRRRRTLQLDMARRLGGVPELFAVAAEQYLPVIDELHHAGERHQVVGLLRRAAHQATLTGTYGLANTLLSAALDLIEPGETGTLVEVHTGRHAALYSLGLLEAADEEYRTIEGLCTTVLARVEATCVQIRSLTNRIRPAEAIGLGIESLGALGIAIPPADQLPGELGQQLDQLHQWLRDTETADELTRPEITDPTLLAATRLINAILPATYFAEDLATHAWLSVEALRIWLKHGPGRTVIGPASTGAFTAVALGGDHTAGYRAMRRILAVGEARGYEPDTSQARYLFAAHSCWSEPIENGLRDAQLAREGLIAGADLTYAGYTYQTAVSYLMDCSPSLEIYVAEVEAGLAFVHRTGGEQAGQWLDSYRWLAGALRGERSDAGAAIPTDSYATNPLALFYAHTTRAVAAAIFGDPVGLARHTAAAMPMLPVVAAGTYSMATVNLLRGLAVAGQTRTADGDERAGLLSELNEIARWLAARAATAPENFLHLLRLIEAERAWATGDFRSTALAFDAARREVAPRQRPWHRALIAEHAARFSLAHGLEHAGYELLALARQEYLAWGATAKVVQLDWAYPTLRSEPVQPGHAAHRRSAVTSGTIDLLGILSASQALSSQTSIDRLHARVVEVLRAMTGATGIQLLLWNDDRQHWLMPVSGGGAVSVNADEHASVAPMSVLRYAQRMPEPLVVSDATQDDRFAADPYFTDVDCCSLLGVPIINQGTLAALLLLENRLIRGAFTTERLDAVQLIASQLAVSLDNVQLYAQLTTSRARIVAAADQARRRIERDLHDGAQQRLVALALGLRAVQSAVPPAAAELTGELEQLVAQATAALGELRELAGGIHPGVLTHGGLPPALMTLADRCTVPVGLDVRVEQRLPEHVEIAAYYVVAEALTNVAKHAHASTVQIDVDTDDAGNVLRVLVSDDGRGGAELARGSGLVGLKDRVDALGGRLLLRTAPGAGTTVRAELPLHHASAAAQTQTVDAPHAM